MKALITVVFTLMLYACGSGSSDEPGDSRNSGRQETVGTEIANDYNNAMDKARNVENLTLEQKNRLDAALEESEGSKP